MFRLLSFSPSARSVCAILSTNKKAFVDIMMVEELRIMPTRSNSSITGHALIAAAFTVLCGMVPATLIRMLGVTEPLVLLISMLVLFVNGVLVSRTNMMGPRVSGLINAGLGAVLLLAIRAFVGPFV